LPNLHDLCALNPLFVRTALFWVIMQRVVVISYRCFGTTYHYSLHNNPEEQSSHLLRTGNLKSPLYVDVDEKRLMEQSGWCYWCICLHDTWIAELVEHILNSQMSLLYRTNFCTIFLGPQIIYCCLHQTLGARREGKMHGHTIRR
jgi:hypothetical protein